MEQRITKRFLKNQSGAVAATYALALIPLIAIAGLAYDYTRLAGMDSELQNAADQAALAGATQLDRQAGAITRAIAAIQGGLVSNETRFSNDGSGNTVSISNAAQITFYTTRADAEAGTNGFTDPARFADAGFVEVTVDTRAANYTLTPVVGALSGNLNAAAVAGLGSAVCRIPPLMVCNPDEAGSTSSNPDFDVAGKIGWGLLAKPGGGGKWTPGNYGYLDIGPNGATGVRQALGWDGPPGNCVSQSGVDTIDVDTQTGNIASGPRAVNTRFDIYDSNGCVSGGTCSPAVNVRKDLMRANSAGAATGNACDIHNSGWQEPANAYHPTSVAPWPDTSPIDSMGHPRDICHAVEDGVTGNCKDDPFGGQGNWDRAAYFRTHYGSSFNWQGIGDLGPNVTRFEAYEYEIDNAGSALADTTTGAGPSDMTTKNQAFCGPAYGFGTGSTAQDRRRISVAVINCDQHNVSGNSKDVPVRKWIDVFLVQPSYARGGGGKWTKQDEIYVEIIGETEINNAGTVGGPLIRRDQPYLVR